MLNVSLKVSHSIDYFSLNAKEKMRDLYRNRINKAYRLEHCFLYGSLELIPWQDKEMSKIFFPGEYPTETEIQFFRI